MNVNKWQRKKEVAKRWSDNCHRQKALRRMERPLPDYPVDRLCGRYATVVINFPWCAGNNTVVLGLDFAPRPHRKDRVVFEGDVMSKSDFLRSKLPDYFTSVQSL